MAEVEQEWTVETLARYLWERAKAEDCYGCRVEERCRTMPSKCAVPCRDERAMLEMFGLKDA